jgi:hypothetical protein
MAKALGIVKHPVADYAAFRKVYDGAGPIRDRYGVLDAAVLQDPADPNSITILHWFPSVEAANGFAAAPELKDAMASAGVTAAPRIEIVVEA